MARDNERFQTNSDEEEFRSDDSGVERLKMIVLDASTVVELLTGSPLAEEVRDAIAANGDELAAPHLLDIEVTSALRGLVAGRQIDSRECEKLLIALSRLPAERYSHVPLLDRIWQLRHNFTAYDAAYIALAEAVEGVLFTCDSRIGRGHRAKVRVFGNS
jgi:predicted nucleic acid-binding protein